MIDLLDILAQYDPSHCVLLADYYHVLVDGDLVPATNESVQACIEAACDERGWACNAIEDDQAADGGFWASVWENVVEPSWVEREHGQTEAEALIPAYTEALQTTGAV